MRCISGFIGEKEQQISVETDCYRGKHRRKKQEISQISSTLRNELAQLLHITISVWRKREVPGENR